MASTNLLRPCGLRGAPFQRSSASSSLHATPGAAAPTGSCNSTAPPAHLVALAPAVPTPARHPTPEPAAAQPVPPSAPSVAMPSALGRRDVLLLSSSLVLSQIAGMAAAAQRAAAAADAPAAPAPSTSGRGFSRYIRRKQLEPLEGYVPLVLEARQVVGLSRELALKNQAGPARELLRAGPFNGLRDNVRAIGDYASRGSAGRDGAAALVAAFFRSLETYDQLLYVAIRDKSDLDSKEVESQVQGVYGAFDALVGTVPADVVRQAQQVLEVTTAKQQQAAAGAAADAAPGDAAAGDAAPGTADLSDQELLQLLS